MWSECQFHHAHTGSPIATGQINVELATVFMSVTNKIPYMSFYMIFVPRKGSLHQPYLMATEAAGLCKYFRPLHIVPAVCHGVLHIHRHSPATVIPVSSNI